ncbi:MAG: lytic transglycosylase domain-containing protein [Desulfobulbales bacterium]
MRWPLFFIALMLMLPLSRTEAAMYSFIDQQGRLHFTNVPADPRYREVAGYTGVRNAAVHGRYGEHIRKAADRYNLDPELIKAIIEVESHFNTSAVSDKGAMGLMQIMPDTAREMEVEAPFEAEANIMGGSRYLRKMLDLFAGDLRLGLAAYNAGPGKVLGKGAIPPIPETEQYVERVLRQYGRSGVNRRETQ